MYGGGWDMDDDGEWVTVDEYLKTAKQRTKTAQMNGQLKGIKRIMPHGEALGELLIQQGLLVSFKALRPVCHWFEKILRGEDGTVFTIVCPDYATRQEASGRVAYTFDGLGDQIGLVARRAFETHMALWRFFRECGLHQIRFVLAMADHEAESEWNLLRVGLQDNREEFLARLRRSQQRLHAAAPAEMKLKTPFLTELNPDLWQAAVSVGRVMASGSIGQGHLEAAFRKATSARSDFYRRWADRWLDDKEVRAMLMAQAAEYVAVGSYLAQLLRNPFIIGADAPVMAPFLQFGAENKLPLLYLGRAEY